MENGEICDETFGSIGTQATVFQAECYAILHGLDLLTARNVNIQIYTDNQSVVHSLKSKETTNKTVQDLKLSLNAKCRENSLQISIKWIKAHIGYPGNEYADELAKKGTELRPYGPEPIIPLNKTTIHNQIHNWTHSQWEARWENRTDSRQTAIFFDKICPRKSNEIVKLHKHSIGRVVRALTGHDHRNRHNNLLEGNDTGACRFCNAELETPSHIILHCPRLLQTRIEHFKSFEADTIVRSWDVKRLTSFLTVEHIAAMEQGD